MMRSHSSGRDVPYFPSGCTFTRTFFVLITLTTSPTYEPGCCSRPSSSRSSRTREL